MKRTTFYFTLFFICFLSSTSLSQILELRELEGLPENLNIKDGKVIDDQLYIVANQNLYKYKMNEGWSTIMLPDSLKVWTEYGEYTSSQYYNEVFDLNEYGQIIMRVQSANQRYLLTTDTSFSQFHVQVSIAQDDPNRYFSRLFYLAKDTILITTSTCSDYFAGTSIFSTDAGLSWEDLGIICVNSGSDYIRIDNKIYWYNRIPLQGHPFGPELFRMGKQSFDLDSLTFSVEQLWGEFLDSPEDQSFKYIGYNHIKEDGTISYLSEGNRFGAYAATITSDDLTELGSGPGGIMKTGIDDQGLFVIQTNYVGTELFYRDAPSEDFYQVQTTLSDSVDIRDILQDNNDGIYVITADKVYSSSEIISTEYDQSLNLNFYVDEDTDCEYDNTESEYAHIFLQLEYDDGRVISHYTTTGKFELAVPQGVGKLKAYGFDETRWVLCANDYNFDLSVSGSSKDMDIGVQPIDCQDLQISSGSAPWGRCFETNFIIRILNDGTIPTLPNQLKVNIPEVFEIVSVSEPYSNQGDDMYAIDIPSLDLFEEFSIDFTLDVSCMDTETNYACISSSIQLTDACESETITTNYCENILAAYDPNAIKVFNTESKLDTFFTKEETQTYQMDFQNTGSFAARTVRLESIIPDHLDLTTFKYVASSHNHEITFRNERTLVVIYEDINLPDSTSNLLESQGFFKYSFQPIEDIEEDTKIYSHADIYFDFNVPIRTNETLAWVDKLSATKNIQASKSKSIIHPNPASDELILKNLEDQKLQKYFIFNCNGIKVDEGIIGLENHEINISHFDSGLYFIHLITENKNISTEKFIKL